MPCITCVKIDLEDEIACSTMVELLDVYACDTMGGGEKLSETVRMNLPLELRKRPTAHVFIAYINLVPAGLAICFEGFSTFECKPLMNIHDFCVKGEFRKKGVAKELLCNIEEFAFNIGCCKITLEVLKGNQAAKSVYHSFGFCAYELNPEIGHAEFWQKKLKC